MLKRKYLSIVMGVICSIFAIIAIMLTSLELVSFNRDFYRNQYEQNNTAYIVGTTQGELLDVTEELLLYLRGSRLDLNITWSDGGEVFGEREIEHMEDVRLLFLYGFRLRNMSSVCAVLLIFLMAVTYPKLWVRYLTLSFMVVSGIFLLLALFIGIGMMVDFDFMWNNFHYIFFTNDLWILDPNTDVLIMMMPGHFFVNIIKKFASTFFAGMGILLISSLLIYRRYGRKNKLGLNRSKP